jgi:hypothetical protein
MTEPIRLGCMGLWVCASRVPDHCVVDDSCGGTLCRRGRQPRSLPIVTPIVAWPRIASMVARRPPSVQVGRRCAAQQVGAVMSATCWSSRVARPRSALGRRGDVESAHSLRRARDPAFAARARRLRRRPGDRRNEYRPICSRDRRVRCGCTLAAGSRMDSARRSPDRQHVLSAQEPQLGSTFQ